MAEIIVKKIEELVEERNHTSDPNRQWEIDCEIENCMNELEGV